MVLRTIAVVLFCLFVSCIYAKEAAQVTIENETTESLPPTMQNKPKATSNTIEKNILPDVSQPTTTHPPSSISSGTVVSSASQKSCVNRTNCISISSLTEFLKALGQCTKLGDQHAVFQSSPYLVIEFTAKDAQHCVVNFEETEAPFRKLQCQLTLSQLNTLSSPQTLALAQQLMSSLDEQTIDAFDQAVAPLTTCMGPLSNKINRFQSVKT